MPTRRDPLAAAARPAARGAMFLTAWVVLLLGGVAAASDDRVGYNPAGSLVPSAVDGSAGGAGPLAAQEADPEPLRRLVADEPAKRVARLLAEGVLVLAPDAADGAGRMVQAWVLFDR